MLMFATANGVAALMLARVVQGIATGAALGAVGAGMLDLDKARGPVANAVTPPLGTGVGGLLAGLFVHYLPAPTLLVYLLLATVFVAQALGVTFMAETMTRRAGAVASLKPQFGLPAAARTPMLIAAPVLVAAWSLAGFYASLIPALMRSVFGFDPSLASGIAAFAFAGSGAYASPEQIRGDRVGIQSDVYSLGVILYELLCDQLPFDFSNKTPAEAQAAILENEPVKPSFIGQRTASEKASNSPGGTGSTTKAAWTDLDVLCLTAMHKDPQRRYRSVEALIRDIDHYLRGEPLEARPDSVLYRMHKFVGRNRRPVAASALVGALIVGLVIFYTLRLAKARNAALAETARTQRVEQFMQDLFQGDAESTGPADDLRVVTVLERGEKQARALDEDPRDSSRPLPDPGHYVRSARQVRSSRFAAESFARSAEGHQRSR